MKSPIHGYSGLCQLIVNKTRFQIVNTIFSIAYRITIISWIIHLSIFHLQTIIIHDNKFSYCYVFYSISFFAILLIHLMKTTLKLKMKIIFNFLFFRRIWCSFKSWKSTTLYFLLQFPFQTAYVNYRWLSSLCLSFQNKA